MTTTAGIGIQGIALAGLSDYGKDLARIARPELYGIDFIRAANNDMALGVTRAAYKAIKNGRDIFDVLLELREEVEYYGVPTQKLETLLARLTILTDW